MQNLIKSQIALFFISWLYFFLFVVYGGSTFSINFVFYMLGYSQIPALVAFYFARKEKLKIPVFYTHFNQTSQQVAVLLLVWFLFIATFAFSFCHLQPLKRVEILLPFFFQGHSSWIIYSVFILTWAILGFLLSISAYLFGFLAMEYMFRGYLWEKLRFQGFWGSSWLIGLISGIWIAPMMITLEEGLNSHMLGISLIILRAVFISPVLVYLRIMTKSILVPAFFFAFIRHLYQAFPFVINSKPGYQINTASFAGVFALLGLNVFVYFKIRKTPHIEYEL